MIGQGPYSIVSDLIGIAFWGIALCCYVGAWLGALAVLWWPILLLLWWLI